MKTNASDFADHKNLAEHIQSYVDRCTSMVELQDHPDNKMRDRYDEDEYQQCYRVADWLKELVNRRNQASRDAELLESTKAQCARLEGEVALAKYRIQALAEIVADLKMELKAKE